STRVPSIFSTQNIYYTPNKHPHLSVVQFLKISINSPTWRAPLSGQQQKNEIIGSFKTLVNPFVQLFLVIGKIRCDFKDLKTPQTLTYCHNQRMFPYGAGVPAC
ncbi:MAG: hypothetical protein KUL75_08970, partial [Sterolibacterium sp.]|nr:hypothetical protein [Sterolibacterium sp.]